MPKIVRILNRFNVGGPTYNVAYLTKYISPNYTTVLVGGQKNDNEASSEYILQQLNISYTIIPEMRRSIGIWSDIQALRRIIRILKTEKPDIVHTHAAKAGTLGRIAAWYCGVPYIYHTFHGHVFHSYFNPIITKIFIVIEKFLASRCTAIVAISELQKHELGTIFSICSPQKIEIIPLGFDLEKFTQNLDEKRKQFRQTYSIADNEIAIGIVGRLVPIKNHPLFIEAFSQCLAKTTKSIRAFIIGDGEIRAQLEELWNSLEADIHTSKLTFTSWIQDVDVVYAGLDIVCLTSHNEGTPVSLIEAQAAGKPIVSTNVGGIQNIVEENKTALLTTNTVTDFTEKLLQIIENDELRETMSAYSQTFSTEKFSYKRLCLDMEGMYEKYMRN
ncbi:MAG TPA: glycosyltransferase [Bacteroidales bacterium]|nr:glycosyltransferase [Bacteroidales bacterium]